MPLHDWTRVDAGVFHDFHHAWVAQLVRALNRLGDGDAPFALAEPACPDARASALHEPHADLGMTPVVACVNYADRQRRVAVRDDPDGPALAFVELVTPGNKFGDYYWRAFRDRCCAALAGGVHLLVLDILPPTPRDPAGVHGSIWGELTGERLGPPLGADRTLASYSGGAELAAYVEPIAVAVGQALRDMPPFLTPGGTGYINVPLEATYAAAYDGVPRHLRRELQGAG